MYPTVYLASPKGVYQACHSSCDLSELLILSFQTCCAAAAPISVNGKAPRPVSQAEDLGVIGDFSLFLSAYL